MAPAASLGPETFVCSRCSQTARLTVAGSSTGLKKNETQRSKAKTTKTLSQGASSSSVTTKSEWTAINGLPPGSLWASFHRQIIQHHHLSN